MNVHNFIRPCPDSSIAATTQVPVAIVPRADREAPSATIPPEAISSYERVHADGELLVGVSGLDNLLETLGTMAWHVERAVERGAGQPYDLTRLQRVNERLTEIHQKVELSAGRLTAKLAGAR